MSRLYRLDFGKVKNDVAHDGDSTARETRDSNKTPSAVGIDP